MSTIGLIQALVARVLYYLTEHADNEAQQDGFHVFDVEHGLLTGRIRRTWPRKAKYEVIGKALDDRTIGVVCRQNPIGEGTRNHRLRGSAKAMKKEAESDFWQDESCEGCDASIHATRSSVLRKVKGKYVLVENVPMGVCGNCGMRYFSAQVLKSIDQTLRGHGKAARRVSVPVYSL